MPVEMNATVYAVLCWLRDQVQTLGEDKQDSALSAAIREADTVEGALAALDEALGDAEAAIEVLNGDEETAGSVAKSIKDAIDALDATVRSGLTEADALETGKHVGIKVVEADGVLTGALVVENDIASADALAKLQAVVGYSELSTTEGAQDAKTVKARLETLESLAGTESVEDQIQAAIEELDATEGSTTVAEGKHVAVQVAQEDGVITGVTVTEDDIASAQDLADLEDELFGEGKAHTLAAADASSVFGQVKTAIAEAASAVDVQGTDGDILVEKAEDANEFTVSLIATGVTAGSGNYVTVDANGRATAIETKNYLELDDDDKVSSALSYADDVTIGGVNGTTENFADQTLVTKGYVDKVKADILGNGELVEALDTIKEIGDFLTSNENGELVESIGQNAKDIDDLQDKVINGWSDEEGSHLGLLDRVDALEDAEESAGGYLKLKSETEQAVESAVNFSVKPTVGTLAEGAAAGSNAVSLVSETKAVEAKADAAQEDIDEVLLAFTTFATENSIAVPYVKA